MQSRCWFAAIMTLVLAMPVPAQQGFTRFFPPEEFAARRAKIMEHIGDAVAIMQGTTERGGEEPLRQSNQFFYLTGVVEPRALLIIDGRTKRTTLFLQAYNQRRADLNYGPYLGPGDAAAKTTGIDAVMLRDSFAVAVARLGADGRTIVTPFRAEVQSSQSADDPGALNRNNKRDPWDGRSSREEAFLAHLKEIAPKSEIRDLDPLIDSLRAFKSAREIAVIREATRQTGLGIMEVMRDVKPGMREYELEAAAEYVYKRGGAFGEAYFPLIAAGPNMPYTHYYKDDAVIRDGDLVQFDWAPDYANYTSDVTRVFPANGKFTPRQAEYYTIYLRLYQSVLTSIRPHVTARSIMDSAYVKMAKIMAAYRFSDPKIQAAAQGFMDRYKPVVPGAGRGGGGSLGHSVGMEVHDVRNITPTLEPGYIFTIEPQMTIAGGELSVRLEDMVLITETGYEVLSGFVPIEIADIEKLMKQPGLGSHTIKLPK